MKKIPRILSLLAVAFLLLTSIKTVWGAETFSHRWGKAAFDTPVAFSEPAPLGQDAVVFVNPPEAGMGKSQLEIVLAAIPKDLQEGLGNNETEMMNYVKGTFLGTMDPADSTTQRSFMGAICKGDLQKTTIPKAGELEIYLVSLSDGDKIAVALTRDAGVPADEARAVMDVISQTFRELPVK